MEEREIRDIAKKRALFKRHLFLYLIVIFFLGVINKVTPSDYMWFLWPALGWGLGIVIHWYFTYAGSNESLEEAEYRKLKKKQSR